MFKINISVALLFSVIAGFSLAQDKPKLVIGIVVDQMRYDYLTRFWDRYGDDGFRKLVNGGYNCKNAHYNYVPTYTGPGHASIFTGTTPSVHGIISNQWYDKETNASVYCVDDASVRSLGTESEYGMMSPNKMLTSTVGDELRISNNFKSKVIGVSQKDRAAILPAGHAANAAYWYDSGSGAWITSSHYMASIPDWVTSFNKEDNAGKLLSRDWNTLYDVGTYSNEDNNKYEDLFAGRLEPTFPYKLAELKAGNGGYALLKATPYGNTFTAMFAKKVIEAEEMGKDEFTDFLTISFSATDYLGHKFGVHSVEVEDGYLRLDRDIADLLNYVEEKVGKDQYTVFLTADHGAVNVPNYLMDHKIPGGYFSTDDVKKAVGAYLISKLGPGQWVNDISNNQVFLNREKIENTGKSYIDLISGVSRVVREIKGVRTVVSAEDLFTGSFNGGLMELVQKGYSQKRSGDVIYTLEPGWIEYASVGTTHGTSYSYDTHVPLVWFGVGINNTTDGENEYIKIVDVAPTVSTILGVQFPSGCTGNPIVKALK